jgi:hypothetical protein
MPGRDHPCEVDDRPAVAIQAVGVEPVVVFVQAGEGAEVDHARA